MVGWQKVFVCPCPVWPGWPSGGRCEEPVLKKPRKKWSSALSCFTCGNTLHIARLSSEQYLLHSALLLLLLCRLFSAAISSRPTTKVLGGQDFVCVFLALFSIVLLQYSSAKQTQCTRSAVKYVTMVNMDVASCLQPLTPLTQHYYGHYNV